MQGLGSCGRRGGVFRVKGLGLWGGRISFLGGFGVWSVFFFGGGEGGGCGMS